MPKPKSPKDTLNALTKIWYEKLTESGFRDIESSPIYLKEWDSHYFQSNFDPLSFENRAEYYRMAEKFTHSHDFPTYLEFKIWELHAQGLSVRDIASSLKEDHSPHCTPAHCELFCPFSLSELYATRLNKDKVAAIIRRLSAIMLNGLKKTRGNEEGGEAFE